MNNNNTNNENSESENDRGIYEHVNASSFSEDNFEEAWIEEAISFLVYEIIREFFEG
jgi:hypothetical protein